jgi:hypothetical protein
MTAIAVSSILIRQARTLSRLAHIGTRQEVINRLRPYLLPSQVRALCSDQSFDVRDKAGKLLAILEVGMYGAGSGSIAS